VTERSHDYLEYGRGCRCQVCRSAISRYAKAQREERHAERVLVNGVLVAPLPSECHGKDGTYNNHGCRCAPCSEAHNAYVRSCRAFQRRAA
jgi:hypothetical protein